MREDLSKDGIHPDQENGYTVLTNLINIEIDKIIQSESSRNK